MWVVLTFYRFVNLFHPLLTSILSIEGLGGFRTVATDTLSVWLQRGVQISSVNSELVPVLDELVTDDDANSIFGFVCDFWDDSGVALGSALRDLFGKIVSLIAKVRKDHESRQVLEKWTQTVLSFPRNKKVVYFTLEILARHIGGSYILEAQPALLPDALSLMVSNALSNPIGKALFSIYSSMLNGTNSIEQWTSLWAESTRTALLNNPELRQHIFIYFLPQMFKLSPQSLNIFASPLKEVEMQRKYKDSLSVFIGCLKIGQEHSIIDVYDDKVLDSRILTKLLHHFSPELRIGALSLLVTSPKGSKVVPSYIFPVLKASMDSILIEIDAGLRHQVHSFLRQFFSRIRGYSYATNRENIKRQQRLDYLIQHSTKEELAEDSESIAKEKQSIEASASKISEIEEFLVWFLGYNQKSLLPGSPYHNLFSGISMLKLLVQSGLDSEVDSKYFEKMTVPFPFTLNLYQHKTVRLLIDTVGSNYEDIRLGATELLHMAPLPLAGLSDETDLDVLKQKVLMMISGMRGREGDSGAHLSELVFYLSQDDAIDYLDSLVAHLELLVHRAQHDLAKSVHEHSIHGTYTSLRYIFEKIDFERNENDLQQKNIMKRVIQSIFGIWEVVKDILCHDSPEGNLPEELESIYNPNLEAKYGPASQVISSYSWRAIKESTLLLKCLLDKCPQGNLFPDDILLKAGDVMMTQLASVKHRGAFSSVYPTYVSCCRRCKREDSLQGIPAKWLNDNLALIQVKSQYITRRSGGLPFLITAVLTADTSKDNNVLLKSTFEELFSIATIPVSSNEEKMDLPQVHAFNCIKTLFIEAELSNYSSIFVDKALDLAIASFSSDVWAIRNCAVMLFTALQNRLFGSKVNTKLSAKLFFSRFKNVRSVLLNNLKLHVEYLTATDEHLSHHVETVYPVLSLLVRLEGINGYDGLDAFVPLIMDCLKSKIWKIREMAARVLASMVTGEEIVYFTKKLFDEATVSRQNELHGTLLAVHGICTRYAVLREDGEFLSLLLSKWELFLRYNPSYETKLEYFRLINLCIPSEQFQIYCIEEIESDGNKAKLTSSRRMLREEIVTAFLSTSGLESLDTCYNLLFDSAYEVQLATLEFLDNHVEFIKSNTKLEQGLWKLFEADSWDQVRGPAIRLFSKVISDASEITNDKYWNVLYQSINPGSTEEILESSLETLGPLTAMNGSEDKLSKWSSLIKKYSHEYESFPTRLSAIKSLIRYLRLVPKKQARADIFFHLYFFLTDDDFDLRDLATEFVAEYLGFEVTTGCYAEGRLLDFITETFADAYDYILSVFMREGELTKEIEKVMKVDEVLFSIEKQNLFRNDYGIFDEFVARLGKGAVNAHLKLEFTKWINNGSKALEKVIDDEKNDGFLGWTSTNGDLFRVLYQIICGIRIANTWNVEIDNLSQLEQKLTLYNIHELLHI